MHRDMDHIKASDIQLAINENMHPKLNNVTIKGKIEKVQRDVRSD